MNLVEIKSLQFNTYLRNAGEIASPVFYLPQNIQNISSLKLKSLSIPLSIFTFDSRNNTGILSDLGTTNFNLTITPGNYNGTTLATELSRILNLTALHTFTVTYNLASNNLSITSTGTFNFIQGNLNNFYAELGITINTVLATTYTTSSINLLGIQQLNIGSNIGAQDIVNSKFKLVGSVPIEEANSTLSTFFDNSNDYINYEIPNLTEISFQLYDSRFRPITMNQDFVITLNFQLGGSYS